MTVSTAVVYPNSLPREADPPERPEVAFADATGLG